MKKGLKTFFKVLLIIIIVIILALAGLITWLSIKEYKPEAEEPISVNETEGNEIIEKDESIDILSWNIGFGGLGKDSDFFMDGGKKVKAADEDTVNKYLNGINEYIESADPDLIMLQEVDIDSSRTYGIDETKLLAKGNNVHAYNYSCPFVPYPVPPIGKVNSGIFTTTEYKIDSAKRVALPCPFNWPIRTANLKRCLLVSYLPIKDSDKQLVIVNLHLEAYDDGEGKIAQTKMLGDFISSEYDKGNYVIAGGDFNQTFTGSLEKYPMLSEDYWVPSVLDNSYLPEGWNFTYDNSVPTCRLLNRPYDVADKENIQHYVIDGFILSPNVQLNKIENVNLNFENSDHNPVIINVTLK